MLSPEDRYQVLDGGGWLLGEFPYTFDGFVKAVDRWLRNWLEGSRLVKDGSIVNPNRVDLMRDDDDPNPHTSNGLTPREQDYWDHVREEAIDVFRH